MNFRWREQGQRDHSVGILGIQVREKDEEMRAWTRVLLKRKGTKKKKYMNLEEWLANYSCRAKSSLLITFLNKVLLACSHAHLLHVICGCFQSTTAGSNSFDGNLMAQKIENIYYLSLLEKTFGSPLFKRRIF